MCIYVYAYHLHAEHILTPGVHTSIQEICSHLRSKEPMSINNYIRTSFQGYNLMYTGVHLDIAWENCAHQASKTL